MSKCLKNYLTYRRILSRLSKINASILCIRCSKIWKFQKNSVSLQRQNVVRGREIIAFIAIFKLDLSDRHTRT